MALFHFETDRDFVPPELIIRQMVAIFTMVCLKCLIENFSNEAIEKMRLKLTIFKYSTLKRKPSSSDIQASVSFHMTD